jgi:leucyl aminopeptidase
MSSSLAKTPDLMSLIFSVREQRVILDAHLAALYGVSTGALNQAIKRNRERFPEDFMMQLSQEEYDNLKSQNVISSSHGGRRSLPHVFTEHGALMAANVLNSTRAAAMSVAVVRAFVRLRQMVLSVDELARKVDSLERKYDAQFKVIFDAVRLLMQPPSDPPRKKIGF